jgi:G3E family GTPase
MTSKIPVHIVTGFLGSGKTTLVNELVRDPAFAGSAVLINELGEIAVDHDLVARIQDGVVETTTGCLCCTATSDITVTLDALTARVAAGEVAPFRRVIVETTGLADPAPVVTALLPPAPASNVYALTSVVTLFDIVHGGGTLDEFFEAIKQVALADAIVLTKTDLALDPATLADIALERERLARLNPTARILDRHADASTVRDLLLGGGSYDIEARSEDALAWLAAERIIAAGHAHAADATTPTIARHDGVAAHCIVADAPLDPRGFGLFLEALKLSAGPKILRLKGLVALADDPDRPVVVHGVQHMIHPVTRLDRWPSDDRRTRLVIIGRDLKAPSIERMLATLKPKRLI